MAVQFSSTRRAAAVGLACAGLVIGAFTLGADRGSAAPSTPGGAGAAGYTGSAGSTGTAGSAGASGSAGANGAATAGPATGGTRITVTGTGNVSGVPNQLVLSMGVQTSAGSVAAALRQANQAVRSVTGVLTRSGVAASGIQTSGLYISPNYSGGSQLPTGYSVSEQISVTLTRLSVAGSQISAAVRAGGNATVVDGVSLDLTNTGTLMSAARAKAVADAKAKAQAYARALGRPLGAVISMSETQPAQPYPPIATPVASAAGSARSVPVSPGTQQLSVTVTVVYALA